ncbi:MAG: tetratricopeptide repeat protein [Terriglobales bacterium]
MRNNAQNKLLCGKLLCAVVLLLSSLTPLAQVSAGASASLLQDAAQAMTAGKLSLAEKDLQSILRTAPQDYRALDLLGVVRALQHREPEAEELFSRAIRKDPDFAPAHAHLGLLFVQKGRAEEAAPELREALRIDASRHDASDALVPILQDQARAAVASGDYSKALPLLTEAERYAPDDFDVQFELGTVELQLSLWENAVETFQQTLKLRPNDPLATYNLGRAFMGLSRFDEARQQFARYAESRPDDASGHCALGMTLAALERAPEAQKQFERSIALAPEQTESYFRLGLIELNEKDLDEAARNFRQVLTHDSKHAAALSGLGRVAFEQKRYSDAIDLLQRAIASDDSLREAHYYLGLTFVRVGRKEEADNQLQIATRLEHDEALHRRTVLRIQGGESANPNSDPKK